MIYSLKMLLNKDELKHFVILSKKKNLKDFKEYISNNNIQLKNFKDIKGENVDILIKSIENNVSSEVVEYIIINGQYETLNYKIYNKVIYFSKSRDRYIVDIYHEKNREDTPLACAIRNNSFELANLLIEYRADIKFLPSEIIGQILNKKNSYYLLEKGYPISENLVRETIWSKKWFIKQSHQYYVFDNLFILNLLMRYKNRIPSSIAQIEYEINQERKKISYEDVIYYWPFKSDQYDILKVLIDYDPQPKEAINDIIYKLLSQHYTIEKTQAFLKIIKNNEFNLNFDSILIETNDVTQLKQYIKANNINLKDFNKKYDRYDDLLRLAIKYSGSIEMIKFIINKGGYDNFNYKVISPEATNVVSLLFFALLLSQYKTFNILIEKGADIYYEGVMQYINKKELIKIQHIKYIVNYNVELNSDLLDKVILEERLDLIKLIFNRYPFNRYIILKLLSLYKKKTPVSDKQWKEMITKERDKQEFLCKNFYKSSKYNEKLNFINIIYENDPRDQDIIIKELFQLFGYEVRWNDSVIKNKFISEIKKKKIKIIVDSNYLNNLYYCGEKREEMIRMINSNNLIELKNYVTKNKIRIEYFNQPVFDLLIHAIETLEDRKENLELILFLIQQYHSLNYYIYDVRTEKYKSPLYCAISMNKFSFSQLLIDHNFKINEDINNRDILSTIYEDGSLTLGNLRYILNNNFNRISSEIIKEWIKNFNNDFLSLTFKHYLYNNDIILNYLNFYKNKTILTKMQFNSIVQMNEFILPLNYEWLQEALNYDNSVALKILFKYFGSYSCIYQQETSNLKNLINIASEKNNQSFFEILLSSELFNFEKNISFEDMIYIVVKYNHSDLVKYLIKSYFKHPSFNINTINIKKIIIYLKRLDDETAIDTFIHELIHSNEFYMSNSIFSNIILLLTKLNNDELTKSRINYILDPQLFNIEMIGINKIILIATKIMDPSLRKYFTNKIILHPTLELNTTNIENILLALNKIKIEDNSFILFILDTIKISNKFNPDLYNKNNLNIEKILINSIKCNNSFMINYIFNEFIPNHTNYKHYNYLENALLTSNENNEYPIIVAYYESECYDSSFELLKYLLNKGIDYNVKDINEKSLFALAIERKNYRVINELFKCKIPIDFDINSINASPIQKAIYNNQLDEVKSLIKINSRSFISKMKTIFISNDKKKNNNNSNNSNNNKRHFSLNTCITALSFSYLLNRVEIFEYLLNGVNINEVGSYGYNILHFALLREDISTIKKLMKLGADINYYYKYLYYPSSLDIVLHLTNKDIILNIINNKTLESSSFKTINKQGETLLITLLQRNKCKLIDKIEIMKIILSKGVIDLTICDNSGNNVLDYAIKQNSLEIIKLLVNNGASLENSLQKNKKFLFKYAIDNASIDIIQYFMNSNITIFTNDIIKEMIYKNRLNLLKLLIPNRIDINKKDEDGHNILFYAYEYQNEEIIEFLNNYKVCYALNFKSNCDKNEDNDCEKKWYYKFKDNPTCFLLPENQILNDININAEESQKLIFSATDEEYFNNHHELIGGSGECKNNIECLTNSVSYV
ncbi:ankyrin [Neocallimastix sp. 'constans']